MDKQAMFKIIKELPFDNNKVVYKKDDLEVYLFRPSKLSKRFEGYDVKKNFEHFLNDLIVIGILSQLFILEQEYGYHRESKFDPPTLFFQGWIREFIDNPKEIDNLCMSVCNGQPSITKYVKFENKKDKKHNPKLKSLWYVD